LRAGSASHLRTKHYRRLSLARAHRTVARTICDGAVQSRKHVTAEVAHAMCRSLHTPYFVNKVRRVASRVMVSVSRGMLVTNGPISQPKPSGMPRVSVSDSHSI